MASYNALDCKWPWALMSILAAATLSRLLHIPPSATPEPMSNFFTHFLFSRVRLVLYDFDLQNELLMLQPRVEARWEVITPKTPETHGDLLDLYSQSVLEKRFEHEEECYVAYVDGKVVSYGWVSYQETEIGEINKLMMVKPDESYLYDFFTRPEYRGKNLYPALLGQIMKSLKGRSYSRLFIFVLIENGASHRGVIKAGFRQFQIVSYVKCLGLRFYIDREGFFS